MKKYLLFNIGNILKHRQLLFGLAIALVLLYHLFCQANIKFMKPFFFGYLGVDIFLYLSSLGLCFAYNKYDLLTFYKRRVQRIYPLYVVKSSGFIIVSSLLGASFGLWYVLSRLTTLYFYLPNQGTGVDWYSCSLLLLYFLFPALYWLVKKYKSVSVWITTIVVAAILYPLRDMEWYHCCLVSRLPIFMVGIYSYFVIKDGYKNITPPILLLSAIIGVLLYPIKEFHYFTTALICPLFINSSVIVFEWLSKRTQKSYALSLLNIMGLYTLEIFYANGYASYVFGHIDATLWQKQVAYIFTNIIMAFVMVYINKGLMKIFR